MGVRFQFRSICPSADSNITSHKMSLSSNSIFHLTSSKDSLRGILESNFKIKYCLETIDFGSAASEIRVPMVSFCDIPLSEIKEHISKYGEYGIGLTKEWAEKNKLNPVLYVARNSNLATSYTKALHDFVLSDTSCEADESDHALTDVLRYIKNYQGDLNRKGKISKDYRFSDEREWRYVPPFETKCDMLVGEDYYASNASQVDAPIRDLRLSFEPNDIRYIIIRDESEITEFVNLLRYAKGNKYSHNDVERLTTRLLTTEQIKGDI